MHYSLGELREMTEDGRRLRCQNAERDQPTFVGLIAEAKRNGDQQYTDNLAKDLRKIEVTIHNCEKVKRTVPKDH